MSLRPGDTLRGGQYEIKSVLGQGGFGITYKAWDRNLKRYVVLKSQIEYLRHDPDYEKYVARFMKEGQVMAKLAAREVHPNLVKVFDLFSEPASHHYLMMEFIEGQNLFEAVKARGRLPEAEVISIAKQIGSALEWMHNHQLVHRDVHPGNIMLRPDGKAVLIDLGGAKEFWPSSQSSKGTIWNQGFAPYEQIVNPKDARYPSADIFGLAGSLYFAVTGSRPTESLKRKLSGGTLTPPGQLVSISAVLNTMLMAGLELEAADRPQSATQFLQVLTAIDQPPARSAESSAPNDKLAGIPWGGLLGCVIAYTLVGIGVSVQPSPLINWAVAVAVAVAWAVAGAVAWAVAGAVAWAVAGAGAGAVAVAVAVAGAGAGAGAVAGAGAGAVAGAWAWAVARNWDWGWYWVLALAVIGAGVGLWRGSWEFVSGYGFVFAGLWWGSWPLTLGVFVGPTADEMKDHKGLAIVLATLAAWVGLAIGWWIYRAVHPA